MSLFRINDWNDAYANAPNIPDGASWPDKWIKPAQDFRIAYADQLDGDISYADHQRAKLDLFYPKGDAQGIAVFVHGGFWLRLDKSYWSHLARGVMEHGFAMAIPSYPLCPDVRVRDIHRYVCAAVNVAASRVSGPIYLIGHSAGGQIVSRMICTDTLLQGLILDRVVHVTSISGVHDLRPLLKTELNQTIGLDEEEVITESPALLEPLVDAAVTCWAGASERSEFIRQNALLANIWCGLGLRTQAVLEPDRHHFNVIDGLANPASPLMQTIFKV